MLGMIMLSLGIVVMLLVCMMRNASKRDGEVDKLLEELEAEEKTTPEKKAEVVPAEEKAAEWEREGDWWKSG